MDFYVFKGLVVISDSDSDSNVASNNVQNENNRNVIYNVDSEDDEYNSVCIFDQSCFT